MRLHLLKEQIKKNSLQGFLVHNSKNIYYLTGFMSTGGAYLLVPEESEPVLWISKLEWNRVREEAENCDLRMIKQRSKVIRTLSKELHDSKLKKVGFDEIVVREYLGLITEWRGEMKNEVQLIWNLRKVKDDGRFAKHKKDSNF